MIIYVLFLCFILCHIKRSQSQSQYIDSEYIGVEKYQDSVLRKLVLFCDVYHMCVCLLCGIFYLDESRTIQEKD